MVEDARVFIVDDDPQLRTSVSRSLRKRGYDVEEFGSAGQFLTAFGDGRAGCIVLDYGLPDMNGLELQAHLMAHGHKIPIVFITGHGGIPESVKATKAGAVDFLEKPYHPRVLAECVRVALDLDALRRKTQQMELRHHSAVAKLTESEKQVFDMMIETPHASSSKAIARTLDISPRTVDRHRAQILLKTECRTVAELIGRFSHMASQLDT